MQTVETVCRCEGTIILNRYFNCRRILKHMTDVYQHTNTQTPQQQQEIKENENNGKYSESLVVFCSVEYQG